jgi:hypothetical protein
MVVSEELLISPKKNLIVAYSTLEVSEKHFAFLDVILQFGGKTI